MNMLKTTHDWVETQAINALNAVMIQLMKRQADAPALGQFYGATGMGKTTAALAAQIRSPRGKVIIARAQQVWASSPKNVLTGLLLALGETAPSSNNATMLQQRLVDALIARECVLIIDEADYLCGNTRLINTLRDVHDNVPGNQPMILIGEENLPKKFEQTQRMHNRFLVRKPCPKITAEEMQSIIEPSGSVRVDAAILARLIEHHAYSVRSMIGAVAEIQNWASAKGIEDVSEKHWHTMPKGGEVVIRQECL